jgi:hypothetical protein
MRYKSLGQLSFDSQHLGRLIDVFLATHIASDAEGSVDRWARGNGVGLGEEDFMSINKVARNVVDVILASHDPAIGNILPHRVLLKWTTQDGRLAGNLMIEIILIPA